MKRTNPEIAKPTHRNKNVPTKHEYSVQAVFVHYLFGNKFPNSMKRFELIKVRLFLLQMFFFLVGVIAIIGWI